MTLLFAWAVDPRLQAVRAQALALQLVEIEWLLVTPRFHHWHHAGAPEAVDRNFAVHLPLLDRLFGTWYFPDGRWRRQLLWPLRPLGTAVR